MTCHNKLSHVSHFHLSLIFGAKSDSQMLEMSPVRGSTLASSRPEYKWLTVRANTLAYFNAAKIIAVKGFRVLAPGVWNILRSKCIFNQKIKKSTEEVTQTIKT